MKAKHVLLTSLVASLTFAACKQSGYKTTPGGGIKYKILEAGKGPTAKVGDYLKFQIITKVEDTTLMNSYNQGGPARVQLQKPNSKFDIMQALSVLSAGDSAIFLIPADSVIPDVSRLPFIKKGDNLQVTIKVLAVQNFQQMQDEMKKEHDTQLIKDDSIIEKYLAQNNLQATKTPGGVYIVVHKQGTGPVPQNGQTVKINYTGMSLDGKPFDSNTDTSAQIVRHDLQPLEFKLGEGMVLRGMDDALLQMKKGTKATIYIPSGLAYGPSGKPPVIQPNENLVFDIDLLDVSGKPSPPDTTGDMMNPASK